MCPVGSRVKRCCLNVFQSVCPKDSSVSPYLSIFCTRNFCTPSPLPVYLLEIAHSSPPVMECFIILHCTHRLISMCFLTMASHEVPFLIYRQSVQRNCVCAMLMLSYTSNNQIDKLIYIVYFILREKLWILHGTSLQRWNANWYMYHLYEMAKSDLFSFQPCYRTFLSHLMSLGHWVPLCRIKWVS